MEGENEDTKAENEEEDQEHEEEEEEGEGEGEGNDNSQAAKGETAPKDAKPAKKIVTLSSDAIGKIRKQENQKGRKAAREELAKEAGFSSVEEMIKAAKSAKDLKKKLRTKSKGTVQQPQETEEEQDTETQQATAQQSSEAAALRRKLQKVAHRGVRLRRTIENLNVERELREAAIRSGILDDYGIEYAIGLLKKEFAGKTEEELEEFDEKEFFSGLKDRMPSLFGVEQRPAHTGNGGTKAPAPKKKEEGSNGNGSNGKVDGKVLSKEQYAARLQELGINNPSRGFSY